MSAEYDDGGWDQNRGYPRGRGRGRGRGSRGRGRGGYYYNGPLVETQQNMGGYNRGPPGQGRGNLSFNLVLLHIVCSLHKDLGTLSS